MNPRGWPTRAMACAVVVLAFRCAAAEVPAALRTFAIENPAAGVYVHYGRIETPTADNAGDIANVGFVVGDRCVAVIDTGGTYAVGAALRNAIRTVTSKPVCFVVNTHVHPDHIFGNRAFVDDRPEFVGHAHLAEAMARRGPNYLNALRRDLGAVADGTELVPPTRAVAQTATLDLGGRTLSLRAWPTAHTDQDLTVYDSAGGVLFLGDLVFERHVPVVDGKLRGMLAALEELKAMPARVAIPGHGRAASWPGVLAAEHRYLEQLLGDVKAAIAAHRTLAETVRSVGGQERGDWALFDDFHRRNVTAAYAELEWE
ncbi:MAG TPA: quinoprotein relay system zinc metallohydrolase 2 [Burkholderiaceae bacterium]|nr:quinoprotein relay system zinc metallohydrolase 2 [Burkholderiaceae bacterium]